MNLKINIIQNPYYSLEEEKVANLMGKIFASRIKGYQRPYGDKVYPFGAEELCASLVSVCKTLDNGIDIPLMSFKFIRNSTCNDFKVHFPAWDTLMGSGCSNDLKDKFHSTKNHFIQDYGDFGYIGSLVLSAEIAENPRLRKEVKKITSLAIKNISQEQGPLPLIVTGTIHNHSHEYIHSLGFQYLSKEEVSVKSLKGTKTYLMALREFNPELNFEDVQHYWDYREVLDKKRELEEVA